MYSSSFSVGEKVAGVALSFSGRGEGGDTQGCISVAIVGRVAVRRSTDAVVFSFSDIGTEVFDSAACLPFSFVFFDVLSHGILPYMLMYRPIVIFFTNIVLHGPGLSDGLEAGCVLWCLALN